MALESDNIEGRIYVEGSQNVEKAPKGLVAPKYMGTIRDQRDMSALGRVQVLRRNFKFISILGFGCTLISTWEVILTLLTSGLTDGGTAGLIWGFIIVTAGFALVFASIAEMASIAKAVFTEFYDGGGWGSPGTATLVGLSTTITSMIGYDCSVHMSEEIKDASETLPKAMMSAVGVNGILGFIMIVTLCFTLGDVNNILQSPTGFPFIQIFYNTTRSYAAANTMAAILVITLTASTITEVATASRQLWSFARDQGLPFSSFFAYVTPGWNIPLNSVLVSLVVTALLSLINIGSNLALNAVISLTITSLMSAYILSIGCVLLKRLRGEKLPPRRWSLGRFGMGINIASLAFLFPIFVFSFFPLTKTVDAHSMNWSVVMYLPMVGFASVYYYFWGRYQFIAPVALVKRDIDLNDM
ncbi:amino acid permease [Aspergillus luchuensis IFO 4308]|nr:amino acid permease [Aspergillus luchuensis IFO 4308]